MSDGHNNGSVCAFLSLDYVFFLINGKQKSDVEGFLSDNVLMLRMKSLKKEFHFKRYRYLVDFLAFYFRMVLVINASGLVSNANLITPYNN